MHVKLSRVTPMLLESWQGAREEGGGGAAALKKLGHLSARPCIHVSFPRTVFGVGSIC